MSTIDQQFIEFIVKSLVGNPDGVIVERRIDEKGVLLELTVDPDDLGRVIGKRGATAQSLRTLLRALGTKNDARYNLKIVDNGEPREDREQYQPAPREDSPADDSSSSDDTSAPDDSGAAQDDTSTNDTVLSDDDDDQAPEETTSDSVSRTRRELEDLDDLDI